MPFRFRLQTSRPDMPHRDAVPNKATERKVREAVEALAFDLDALVEFGSDEDDDQ